MIGYSVRFIMLLLLCVSAHARGRRRMRGGRSSDDKMRHDSLTTLAGSKKHKPYGKCELEIQCKGEELNTLPLNLPIRGPRGHQGLAGSPGPPGEDGEPGIPGLPGLSAPTPKKIAFFAGLVDNFGPVKTHKDVVFDRVVTNIGGAYGPTTGRFTTPVNGTYHFNIVVAAQGRQKAAVMILKNGMMMATVWAESIPYWASASNALVLSLEKGDQIWLSVLNRASYLHGYMYTTFSGYLIFEN